MARLRQETAKWLDFCQDQYTKGKIIRQVILSKGSQISGRNSLEVTIEIQNSGQQIVDGKV